MKAEPNPVKRNLRKPTYLNSIRAMCAHCHGCTEKHLEPGFRESIRDCTAPKCPLYHYRPYQTLARESQIQREGERDTRGMGNSKK